MKCSSVVVVVVVLPHISPSHLILIHQNGGFTHSVISNAVLPGTLTNIRPGGYNGRSSREARAGCNERTKHFLSRHYSQLLSGTCLRNFSPAYCRLKYSWFARYGRIPAPKDSPGRFNRGTPNGCIGRTVRDRVGNGWSETFLAARRNFSPEGCRLKYSWFSRYGRKS